MQNGTIRYSFSGPKDQRKATADFENVYIFDVGTAMFHLIYLMRKMPEFDPEEAKKQLLLAFEVPMAEMAIRFNESKPN